MSVDSDHSTTGSRSPTILTERFAARLRLSKAALLDLGHEGSVPQTGAAIIGGHFAIPVPPASLVTAVITGNEPRIETFMVDASGRCQATGSDGELINHLQEPAERLAAAVLSAMAEFGVELSETAYLSGSVTPIEQVTTTPHLDDDQFVATEGVGVVAIVANGGGPRIATEAVEHAPARSGLPLEVAPSAFERFAGHQLDQQVADAERIVLFPQFGQLHCGPDIGPSVASNGPSIRTLLVFRAGTVPNLDSGSDL